MHSILVVPWNKLAIHLWTEKSLGPSVAYLEREILESRALARCCLLHKFSRELPTTECRSGRVRLSPEPPLISVKTRDGSRHLFIFFFFRILFFSPALTFTHDGTRDTILRTLSRHHLPKTFQFSLNWLALFVRRIFVIDLLVARHLRLFRFFKNIFLAQ